MEEINKIYQEISSLKSLKPSKKVNKLFRNLVNHVVGCPECIRSLNAEEITNIRKLCAEAEYEFEFYWAKKIIDSMDPNKELRNFDYYENYCELVKLEIGSLNSCKHHKDHRNVLFIGSGPLPLTGIILARDYELNVTLVDYDKDALEISEKIISSLGLRDKFTFVNSSGEDLKDFSNFDIIFLASLAGISGKEKKRILDVINNNSSKGTHIIARSSYGSRKILYPSLEEKYLDSFHKLIEVKPLNKIINSFYVLRT